jgi:hypothetical protein
MSKQTILNIREVVEQEIRNRLDDIISNLTAVEPIKQEETSTWIVCGNCAKHLLREWVWCPHCGRKVKWDG